MITYAVFESVANWIVGVGVMIWLTVIIISWLATFRSPKAAAVGQSQWFRLPRWAQIMSGIAIILLLAGLASLLWIPLPITLPLALSWASGVVGLLLFMAGLTFILWARYALGAMYNVSATSGVQLQARHQLVRHGPYAFVRHPMYLGHWLLLGGILLVYLTWTAVLFLLLLLPLYRRARFEESALADTFGAEWEAYAARTKFIIPFLPGG